MVRPLTSGRKGVVVVGAGDLFPSPSIKELGETGIEGNSGPGGRGQDGEGPSTQVSYSSRCCPRSATGPRPYTSLFPSVLAPSLRLSPPPHRRGLSSSAGPTMIHLVMHTTPATSPQETQGRETSEALVRGMRLPVEATTPL